MSRSPCVDCGSTDELVNGNCPNCGAHQIVQIVNEPREIVETVNASLGIYFELTDPIAVPGTPTNASDIELEFDSVNTNMLKAFTIKTRDESEEEIINALHRAARLTDYLTFKTGLFVYHKQGRKVVNGQIESTPIRGGIGMLLTTLRDLDLTDQTLNDLISNTSRETLQLAHCASGQRALNDENFNEAIREFFLVIENSGTPEVTKYRPLRNAVSHEILREPTVSNLNTNFGLNVSAGGSLDITDPVIEGLLRTEANKLREIAWCHINNTANI